MSGERGGGESEGARGERERERRRERRKGRRGERRDIWKGEEGERRGRDRLRMGVGDGREGKRREREGGEREREKGIGTEDVESGKAIQHKSFILNVFCLPCSATSGHQGEHGHTHHGPDGAGDGGAGGSGSGESSRRYCPCCYCELFGHNGVSVCVYACVSQARKDFQPNLRPCFVDSLFPVTRPHPFWATAPSELACYEYH